MGTWYQTGLAARLSQGVYRYGKGHKQVSFDVESADQVVDNMDGEDKWALAQARVDGWPEESKCVRRLQ